MVEIFVDYLICFLLVAVGYCFIKAAITGIPIYSVIRSNFLRLVLWEMFATIPLFLYGLVFRKEDLGKWEKDVKKLRNSFLEHVSEGGTQLARQTWYMVLWFWLETKVKLATGLMITFLSSGLVPVLAAPASQNKETTTAAKQGDQVKDGEKVVPTVTFWFEEAKGTTSQGQFMNLDFVDEKGKVTRSIDLMRWNPNTSNSTDELQYWPNSQSSQIGLGIQIDQHGGSWAEINGLHNFSAIGGKGSILWQTKVGMSGPLSPNTFQINTCNLTWQANRSLQLGIDSKLRFMEGVRPTYKIGGVANLKLGDVKLKLRHFVGFDGNSPSTELWLVLPLGGTGP